MKKIFSILFTFALLAASAQNPTAYFMEGSAFRSQWNPAFAPQQGYFNFPFIGGLQANIQGNIALDNIIYSKGNHLVTILDSSVSANDALSGLQKMNRFGTSINMNLLGFGSYTKNRKNFWSFDINMRANAGVRAPYEFFDFIKTGHAGNFTNLGADIDAYIETGFAYTLPIIEKLYIGIRAKFLIGAMRAAFNFDTFDAHIGEDKWYAHTVGSLTMSGLVPDTKRLNDGTLVYNLEDIGDEINVPGGYGLGFDIGATYDILPNLQISLSVNDIGFMHWSKASTAIGQVNKDIEFTGVEISSDGTVVQPSFDLDDLNFEVMDAANRNKVLRASINAGGEYNFFDRKIGLGLFYNAKFWEFKTQHNITASANFRPMKWLHVSSSYSFLDNKGHSLGLAFNLCPGFINLFVATDILLSKKTPQWIPTSQSNMNITFGLGFPIGKRGLHHEVSDN